MTVALGQERVSVFLLDGNDAPLFPKLTEAQVQLVAHRGVVRPTVPDDVLVRQGTRPTT